MTKLGLSLLAAAFVSTSATAGTAFNDRGLNACERLLTKEYANSGLTFERQYMVERGDAARTFFINGYVRNASGEREQLASTCITTSNGRRVLELETELGNHVAAEKTLASL